MLNIDMPCLAQRVWSLGLDVTKTLIPLSSTGQWAAGQILALQIWLWGQRLWWDG